MVVDSPAAVAVAAVAVAGSFTHKKSIQNFLNAFFMCYYILWISAPRAFNLPSIFS